MCPASSGSPRSAPRDCSHRACERCRDLRAQNLPRPTLGAAGCAETIRRPCHQAERHQRALLLRRQLTIGFSKWVGGGGTSGTFSSANHRRVLNLRVSSDSSSISSSAATSSSTRSSLTRRSMRESSGISTTGSSRGEVGSRSRSRTDTGARTSVRISGRVRAGSRITREFPDAPSPPQDPSSLTTGRAHHQCEVPDAMPDAAAVVSHQARITTNSTQ